MRIIFILFLILAGCSGNDRGSDHARLNISSGEVSVTAYDSGEVLVCYWPKGRSGYDCESLQLDLDRGKKNE